MASAPVYLHYLLAMSLIFVALGQNDETQFTYNGFQGSNNTNMFLDGLAKILPNGLLQMNNYSIQKTSHAFYPRIVTFKPNLLSFSTTFVFAMNPLIPNRSGPGIVFVITPSKDFHHALSQSYFGLFNTSNKGLPSNHIFGVELDTFQNPEVEDIDGNHVGIDVNSLRSIDAASASYYSDAEGVNKTALLLNSGKPIQIWIDYDEVEMLVNVTLAPLGHSRPNKCLISKHINLSTILLDSMYIGFSSATGLVPNIPYILGWSWSQNGKARELDLSKLPSLPETNDHKKTLKQLIFVVLLTVVSLLLLIIVGAVWFVWRKKYEELYESWEKEYAPQRFLYKELYVATKGFRNSQLLGVGGFGEVYKGELPATRAQVAVKRVTHDSRQGMKEFVAEISSMRRLRHKNLVQLLGYCRRKEELLLVYDYMPNGSLDGILFANDKKSNLSWSMRFNIIKGVASALLYLHEEWEQVVLHRDVKASNVLLDAQMNARLGDFGLARLYDHNSDPETTRVVGTMGYIAPEVSRTRRPTTKTDVFAFGMFLLEVGCGRRPVKKQADEDAEDLFLTDWVFNGWKRGKILDARDPKLEGHYQEDELELVLKLGLLCLHHKADARPTMRQVVQFLNRNATLPDIPPEFDPESTSFSLGTWGTPSLLPTTSETGTLASMSSTNSILQYGR